MKKLFYWILLVLSLFAIVRDTSAISYDGSNSYSLPDMNFTLGGTNWIITPKNTTSRNSLWTAFVLSHHYISGLSCFRYTNSTSNGYLFSAGLASSFQTEFTGVHYSIQNTASGKALIDTTNHVSGPNNLWRDNFIGTQDELPIMYLPTVPDTAGDDAFVICVRPVFDNDFNSNTYYEGTTVWLYGYGSGGTSVVDNYVERNWRIRGVQDFYDWTYSIIGYLPNTALRPYTDNPLQDSNATGSLYYYYAPTQYSNVNYQPDDLAGIPAFAFTQDFFGYNDYNFVTTLPEFFSTTGTGIIINPGDNTGTGGTGTGGVDTGSYYQDCDGITDLGCYIAGFSNFIFDIPGIIFDKIINTILGLLPDISFSGTFNSCSTDFNSEDATWTDSLKNFLAFLNPFMPPGEGEIICTVWGEEQLHYSRLIPEQNFFELYLPNAPSYLTVSPYILPGQTIFDIILISVMIGMIFYKRHH